ncbi:MAG: LptF/LptG family permease [Bacteroidota bacterium]
MKILDRYIIKQFLQMAGFGLVAFTAIFVVVDMMENLDDFIDRDVPFTIVVQYYVYFMPEIIKLMIPVAVLLSSLFTTGRLSTFNEISAMKASGVSLYRFMLPMLIVALLISGASVYFNGWVLPYANHKKFTIARVHLNKYLKSFGRYNIFIQDSPTRIVSLANFDDATYTAHRVTVQDYSEQDRTRMIRRYDAKQMAWDSTTSVWVLIDCTMRTFEGNSTSPDSADLRSRGGTSRGVLQHEQIARFDTLTMVGLNFIPSEIKKKQQRPDEMNYYDLQDFIENQKRAGHEVARWEVDFYSKVSFPFASFIVVLFGVPFSSIKRRSGLAVEFGLSLGICFIYLTFMKISHTFGYNGDLNPLATAWFANVLFFLAGIVNLWRVRK